jgi:hypothetical protein
MDRSGEKTQIDTRLEVLRAAHRALDLRINQMAGEPAVNLVELQRLKKQKLALKDRLTYLEGKSHPDIIA